jgi:hypothetical protein
MFNYYAALTPVSEAPVVLTVTVAAPMLAVIFELALSAWIAVCKALAVVVELIVSSESALTMYVISVPETAKDP